MDKQNQTKKIVCDETCVGLTKSKIYEVFNETPSMYLIMDDFGNSNFYRKTRFHVCNENDGYTCLYRTQTRTTYTYYDSLDDIYDFMKCFNLSCDDIIVFKGKLNPLKLKYGLTEK
jgi:hypothetical protein